jgi:hypothetical protein
MLPMFLHRPLPRLWIPRRRMRRWLQAAAVSVVAAACLLVLMTGLLIRLAPSWWRTVRRDDPATIALGQQVENRITNHIYRNRASQTEGSQSVPWTIEVKAPEANAWLNCRLPKWLANQKDEFHWPRDVSDVQVEFDRQRITVGARVKAGERSQVFTATLEPKLERDGRLYMTATWVNVGRLSVPAGWVLGHARRNADQFIPEEFLRLPETELLFRAFAGETAVRNNTVIELGDGRTVRILRIDPEAGKIRITCQTELE